MAYDNQAASWAVKDLVLVAVRAISICRSWPGIKLPSLMHTMLAVLNGFGGTAFNATAR